MTTAVGVAGRGGEPLLPAGTFATLVGAALGWASSGPRFTDRDIEILTWIGRHGVVTRQQVARRFFTHDGTVAQKRAYRRIAKLEAAGLVRRDTPFAHHPSVLRLRAAGVRGAAGGVPAPARYVVHEIPHDLAVVDLVEELLAAHPGARLQTGREVRAAHSRERNDGRRDAGTGRIPDAVLTLATGKTVAIEVGLVPRTQSDYRAILLSYKQERFAKVWWYVPQVAVERVRRMVHEDRYDDVIDVRAGPGPAVGHPEVTGLEVEILTWIGRHGLVTNEQVARRFFTREDGRVGVYATSKRLRHLETGGLVHHTIPAARQPAVFRLTAPGANLSDAGIRPAGWVPAEIAHSLAVVDLMELLAAEQPGARVRTEREIRTERGRDVSGRPARSDGRIPDGELILASGKVVAVELDLTSKRTAMVQQILRLYERDTYSAVWWFVRPGTVTRMTDVVRAHGVSRLVEVHPWMDRHADGHRSRG